MTATLDNAGRLSQEAGVRRDRLAGGLTPAEVFCPLQTDTPSAFGVRQQRARRAPQRHRVAVRNELAAAVHNLWQARVRERRHRAAARHRLQARQAEALVAAGEQEATP